ncbi:hypothetical protein N7470_004401 [Penicillium chermesinum]|nr:hypothetical protein N7470_004401 [Penicillium chermesinum]
MLMKPRICRDFARRGFCRFDPCRFAHIRDEQRTANNNLSEQDRRQTRTWDFDAWRRLVAHGRRSQRLGNRLGGFFVEARRLIDINEETLQGVIWGLSEEGGLRRIQELIERDFAALQASAAKSLFLDAVLPFLETITAPNALGSLVLEPAMVTIYNCIFGPVGRRGGPFLSFLADAVKQEIECTGASAIPHLDLSLLVFSKIVEFNSTAFILESLKPVGEKFAELLKSLQALDNSCNVHQSYHYLEQVSRRLDAGLSLPILSETGKPTHVSDPTAYTVEVDPPGGRHDNDHRDIRHIKILPTFEEINSMRAEYLPQKDPRQWHVEGLFGLLDRNFRLLREDTVGQLRDAIHDELHPSVQARTKDQAKSNVYKNAVLQELEFNRVSGLQFLVQFEQVPRARAMTKVQRKEWWNDSKRLLPSALVCLLDAQGAATFCTVVNPDIRKRSKDGTNIPAKGGGSLSDSPNYASVMLELVGSYVKEYEYILEAHASRRTRPPMTLVEFPRVLLPSFEPTLIALQRIKGPQDLPMLDYLVPGQLGSAPASNDVPPPLYATSPGFSFDLKCLMDDDSSLEIHYSRPADIDRLTQHSALDGSQASALARTLQRRIGLIQGPPGTGKSFTGIALIKVLLANKIKVKDFGPIICVCYTNHALDQLLEELLRTETTSNVLRIGSQSQSESLQRLNLRTVARKAEKTRMKYYLQKYHAERAKQLFEEDEEGYQKQAPRGPKGIISSWLNGGQAGEAAPRSLAELENVHVDAMTREERKLIYADWVANQRGKLKEDTISILLEHATHKRHWDTWRDELDLRCLHKADVIGITTSGLARSIEMLRFLKSKVMICEEASEVLEAHLLVSILPSIEQVILIGDHQQLRPQIQNHNLSRENESGKKYFLDRSLFERLVEPDDDGSSIQVPYCTLETQRRMHPSISLLVRNTLYPRLQDAPLVYGYPEVAGMRKRLFWLDHRRLEAGASDEEAASRSHWNVHEVRLTVALVNHLLRQGVYKKGEIAVLTPYLGQLYRLRRELSQFHTISLSERDEADLENAGFTHRDQLSSQTPVARSSLLQTLRVSTIDNFQGEEAKVVVISLVRSNKENRCGFLRTHNRINVLLSRAKHGMYIIGNSLTAQGVEMWDKVINMLKSSGNIGPELELTCPRHPDTPIAVSDPEHFVHLSPEGGCNMQCHTAQSLVRDLKKDALTPAQKNAETHAHRSAPFKFTMKSGFCRVFEPRMVFRSITEIANRYADANILLAHTAVERPVMELSPVHHAKHPVPYSAAIRDVLGNAQSHAYHVPCQSACPRVRIIRAQCHVEHRAITSLALCAARKGSAAVINVLPLEEIKNIQVDFILGKTYEEIDLDSNPCIFPHCGHFLTIESMDGQMNMRKHYTMDDMGRPVALASSATPFSIEDIRSCATCRGSLQNISRYGRLVRRALLDESTKKFILYANEQYPAPGSKVALFPPSSKILIEGPLEKQVRLMNQHMTKSMGRWKALLALQQSIVVYKKKVNLEEQPFNKVRNMVENARRRKAKTGQFEFDSNVLQFKGYLQAFALLLRLDTALLSDFLQLRQKIRFGSNQCELRLNLDQNRKECRSLIESATSSHRVTQQVEGHIFLAQFCALELRNNTDSQNASALRQEGLAALDAAERVCSVFPSQTRGLDTEIEGTRSMIRGEAFYTPITNAERMDILEAMSREFTGTGHWYYCANGHPFTIGECGGAMEVSTCPECGAPVGEKTIMLRPE